MDSEGITITSHLLYQNTLIYFISELDHGAKSNSNKRKINYVMNEQLEIHRVWKQYIFHTSLWITVLILYVNPCKALMVSGEWKPIKVWRWDQTPIIVAVLLQHHYLHIQSSSGQKGIQQRTVPYPLSYFSDQAFRKSLLHCTVWYHSGITLASKMYVVWKLLQCTLMQLY